MRRRFLLLYTTLVAAIAVACVSSDTTTSPIGGAANAPVEVAPASSNLLGLGNPTEVTPLLRNAPLAQSVSATATVGPLGGVLSLPSAGLLVVVPPLAATGALSPQVLGLRIEVYDPVPHYHQVRDAWGGVRIPDGR